MGSMRFTASPLVCLRTAAQCRGHPGRSVRFPTHSRPAHAEQTCGRLQGYFDFATKGEPALLKQRKPRSAAFKRPTTTTGVAGNIKGVRSIANSLKSEGIKLVGANRQRPCQNARLRACLKKTARNGVTNNAVAAEGKKVPPARDVHELLRPS